MFWTEEDINTRFFSSVAEQNTYFDSLTAGKFSSLSNFNMGNNINTAITYRDDSNRSVEELVACNYAVVQKYDEETGVILSRRYFFAYPQQDSGRQMRVTLSLDDIQTNYFTYKDKIAPCMIKRACLDRWVDNNDGTVSFNGNVDSTLFEREGIQNVAKRLTKRTKINQLKPYILDPENTNYQNNKDVIDWLNNNVYAYVYIFCDPNHEYNVVNNSFEQITKQFKSLNIGTSHNQTYEIDFNSGLNTNLVCFCFPITKDGYDIISGSNNVWSFKSFNDFLNKNNQYSYIYSIKLSGLPPFTVFENGGVALLGSISSSGKTLNLNSEEQDDGIALSGFGLDYGTLGIYFKNDSVATIDNPNSFMLLVEKQISNIKSSYVVDTPLKFQKSEIINSNTDPKFNPKLLNSDYKDIKIVSSLGGEGFSYDFQKLNNNNLDVEISEPILPDISRTYARFSNLSGIYISETSRNFTGDLTQSDLSLNMATEKFQDFLANNKNYFLQNAINRTSDAISGITGGAFSIASGNFAGGGMSIGKSILNMTTSLINEKLTVDNMKNAPGLLKVASGSGYLTAMVDSIGCYIEEYDILPNEKQIINDYLNQFGFTYNKLGNIKDFDNIRFYFNYIEASVETISAPISNIEKNRLRQRLQSVRFWNSDTIDYSKENYERSIAQ